MSGKLCLTIVALMLLVPPSLQAQPATMPSMPGMQPANDPPEAKDVRDATKAFMASLADKDVAAAKKLFAGSDEDFQLVETMHDLFQAGKKLKDAAEAKWPEEVKSQFQGDDFDPKKQAERIDHQRVSVEGDTAKLSGGAMLKKVDGKWKVIDVISDPMGKGMINGMFKSLTPLFNEAAADIEAGKYSSLGEAKAAIQQKMQANMKKNMMGPMGRPTTMPTH
jgi:hypothetical protein